jgi:SpoIIAA-like
MPIEFEFEGGGLAVARVSGKLRKVELDRAQRECEEMIKKIGRVKILVLTKNFAGWERAEGWDDTSFADRNDPYIEKIAVVGGAKWRDLVYAFTGRGLRPVPIQYFEPDQEGAARQWLVNP